MSDPDNVEVDGDAVDAIAEHYWNALLQPWLDLNIPRLSSLRHLAHYCSFETLAGIVSSETLWFSPPTLMTDFNEIVAGKQLILDNATSDTRVATAMALLKSEAPGFWQEVGRVFDERLLSDLDHTFISCWSECELFKQSHDNLTMWRGYAGEGNGVALVVDAESFGTSEYDIVLCPVFYETPEAFSERADKAVRDFLVQYLKISAADRLTYQYLAVAAFSDLLFLLAVSHKHPGFIAEAEWRFVWLRKQYLRNTFDAYVEAKLSPRGIFERLCLPVDGSLRFGDEALDMRTMLREVMVGPCNDQEAQVLGVRRLLENAGFDLNAVRVTKSQIPFRHRR